MKRFRHPLWPDVTYTVADKATHGWLVAGWVPVDEPAKTTRTRKVPATVKDHAVQDATEPKD